MSAESEALEVVSAFAAGQPLHCKGFELLSPVQAEGRMLEAGLTVYWRYEYSTGPDTGYAEYRPEPPEGVIIAADMRGDEEVVVTVVPEDDKLAANKQLLDQRCGSASD